MDTICTEDGCANPEYARGYCKKHYAKHRNTGKLKKLPPKEPKFCSATGCNKPHSAKGLCAQHYREYKVRNNPRVYKDVELRRQSRHRERKAQIIDMLGGKCVICGFSGNPACFDFHHTDPREKEHEPRSIIKRTDIAETMKELAKCILLCKNCHADIHHPLPQEEKLCYAP